MSVSRTHAVLHCGQSGIYLEDCNAKFGTLKMFRTGTKLGPGSQLALQCGRTVCTLEVEKPWSLFSGCFCGKPKRAKDPAARLGDSSVCFPGEGKNSLLVVKHCVYQRLLRKDEKVRRDAERIKRMKAIQSTEDLLICGATKRKDMGRIEGSSFLKAEKGQRLMRTETLPRTKEGVLANAARLERVGAVQSARGDTADDVFEEDCAPVAQI